MSQKTKTVVPDGDAPLSREDCLQYLDQTVFALNSPPAEKDLLGDHPGRIGLEVEMLPLLPGSTTRDRPRVPPLYGQGSSVAAGVEAFCDKYAYQKYYASFLSSSPEKEQKEYLYNVVLEGVERITFEPGGQIEFSSQVQDGCGALISRINLIQEELANFLKEQGIDLIQVGMNPWHGVEEIGLQLHQGRYERMNRYFSSLGTIGPQMMRQTLSIQVNLDYGWKESQLVKRYLAAQLLVPFSAAIFANSPLVEGKPGPFVGQRFNIWQHLDPYRSGIRLALLRELSRRPEKSLCVKDYLDFALAAPVMFIERLNFHRPENPQTFGQWLESPYNYEGEKVLPKLSDFKSHLSLLFPEVRPRGFLELRTVDGQFPALQYVPMVYFLGLLYDERSLEGVLDLLVPNIEKIPDLMKKAVYGLKDPEIAGLARRLMELAEEGGSRLPDYYRCKESEGRFKKFRQNYTEKDRTPADDLMDNFKSGFGLDWIKVIEEIQKKQIV